MARNGTHHQQIFIRAFEAKILSLMGFVNLQLDTSEVSNVLQKLDGSSWEETEKIKIDEKVAMELERILRYHVERVLEGALKSRKFLGKLK